MATISVAWIVVLCSLTFVGVCMCMIEPGIYDFRLTEEYNLGYFQKVMFNRTHIGLKIQCKSLNEQDAPLKVRWMLYWASCFDELAQPDIVNTLVKNLFKFTGDEIEKHSMYVSKWEYFNCTDDVTTFTLEDKRYKIPDYWYDYKAEYDYRNDYYDDFRESGSGMFSTSTPVAHEEVANESENPPPPNAVQLQDAQQNRPETPANNPSPTPAVILQRRKRRAAKTKEETKKEVAAISAMLRPGDGKLGMSHVAETNHDGPHLFALVIMSTIEDPDVKFNAEVTVDTKGPRGYLSAMEWPLLPFYGVMSAVYLVYGIAWLVMMFMNWRDLLCVQLWIGGVILIGLLEKAVYFAEFEYINNTGRALYGAMFFAKIVSALKRSLARVLVIMLSLGAGFVRPRLGPVLNTVLAAVGTLYFFLGSFEGWLSLKNSGRAERRAVVANIAIFVLDLAILCWVLAALVQVMRTLRLSGKIAKMSLYRNFRMTVIFAVLACIVYMAWSIKVNRLRRCVTDWHELWVNDAFWHILFCIILGVIIVLWRPSANKLRLSEDTQWGDEEKRLLVGNHDDTNFSNAIDAFPTHRADKPCETCDGSLEIDKEHLQPQGVKSVWSI